MAEFQKYLAFALNDKRLLPHEEETLLQFGRDNALSEERIQTLIEAELASTGAMRVTPPTPEKRDCCRGQEADRKTRPGRRFLCACSG